MLREVNGYWKKPAVRSGPDYYKLVLACYSVNKGFNKIHNPSEYLFPH